MRAWAIIALCTAAFGLQSCAGSDSGGRYAAPIVTGGAPIRAAAGSGLAAEPAAMPAVVQATRIGVHRAATRLVIEASAPVAPQQAASPRPDRVVLTLPNLRLAPDLRAPRGRGLIRTVRYQPMYGDRGVQIVLGTGAPASIANMFVIEPSRDNPAYRVVIDLVGAGAAPVVAGTAAPQTLAAQTFGTQAGAGAPRTEVIAVAPQTFAPRTSVPQAGAPRTQVMAVAPQAAPALTPVTRPAAAPQPRPAAIARAMPVAPSPRAATKPAPAAQRPARRQVVVIDPGHGGQDPGAIGRKGEFEKTIVFAVARALRKELLADGRFDVVMTRNSDTFIPLGERVAIARRAGANLFLSIHADTISDPGTRGAGVYTLSAEASDAQAAALAAKENRADIINGVDLSGQSDEVSSILIDFAQHGNQERSMRFAELLVPRLGEAVSMRQRSHRGAGFRVLKAPDVPSVLVELGYLSNPAEEAELMSPKGQAALAHALARGIEDYFGADS